MAQARARPRPTGLRGCQKLSPINVGSIVRLQQQRQWAATNIYNATLDGGVFRDTRLRVFCSAGERRRSDMGRDQSWWRLANVYQRATLPELASRRTLLCPSGASGQWRWLSKSASEGRADRRHLDSCLSCQLWRGARRNTRSSSSRAMRRRADECRARWERDGRRAFAGGRSRARAKLSRGARGEQTAPARSSADSAPAVRPAPESGPGTSPRPLRACAEATARCPRRLWPRPNSHRRAVANDTTSLQTGARPWDPSHGCLWGPWEWEWPEAWQLAKVPWLACRCLPALPLFDSHAHRLWPNDEQADDNPGRILVRWLAPALECPIGQLPLGIALPGSPADMFHWLFNQRLPPLSRFFHALADPRPLPSSRATLQRPPSLLELPTHPTPLSWSFPQLPKSKKGTWSQLSRLDLPSLTASPGLLHTVPQSSSTASTGSSPASRSPCARLRVLYLPSAILDGLG